ncbi:hypothetical protein [Allocoleopsis sp.]
MRLKIRACIYQLRSPIPLLGEAIAYSSITFARIHATTSAIACLGSLSS